MNMIILTRLHFNSFISLILLLVVAGTQLSCSKLSPTKIKAGNWRAVLTTKSGAEIPFNFELTEDYQGIGIIHIRNGDETILVEDITYKEDSVIIKMPVFDSEFRALVQTNEINGSWIKHLADKDVIMPFKAKFGENYRFFKSKIQAAANLSGKWETLFISDEGDSTKAIGEFVQQGFKLRGTFLTSTGDYRFLEGNVAGNSFNLSCFDGSHAFLFTAKVNKDSTLTEGKFYSGYSYSENWTAFKNSKAELPDAYSLTYLKPGYNKIDFNFPDLEGKKTSLNDARFQNKVVILQIMGSWCPNCMDETAYLTDFYKNNRDKGLEIIGLAYERSPEFEKAVKNVSRLKTRFNITYPLLIAGISDKEKAAETLPMLNHVMSFPTTIIIDRKGKVRKIHTGFYGPGTGKHYTEFVTDFESTINSLLEEK